MKHSAYGATITAWKPLDHPKGLRWAQVTWEVDGKSETANTYPGGTVYRQLWEHPRGGAADIILNGRSQVVAVLPHRG